MWFDYRVVQKGGPIEGTNHVQSMVWCSDVELNICWQNGLLSRVISGIRVSLSAGEPITSYRRTSSRLRLAARLRAVVLRLAIAADKRTYISWAESVQSALGGYPRKAASAALCSSYVSGFGSVMRGLMSRGNWPRLLTR